MSKPVSGVNTGVVPPTTGTTATSAPQAKNYGQVRSELAHSMNAMRAAMRTGDESALKTAALSLANLLHVNLGDTSKMSGSDVLSALSTKAGISPETIKNSDPTQMPQATTSVQAQALISKL